MLCFIKQMMKHATSSHFFFVIAFRVEFNKMISKKFQGTFRIASWRGTQVAVKRLGEEVITDEDKVWVAHGLEIFFFVLSHILMSFKEVGFSFTGEPSGMSLHCFKRYDIQM